MAVKVVVIFRLEKMKVVSISIEFLDLEVWSYESSLDLFQQCCPSPYELPLASNPNERFLSPSSNGFESLLLFIDIVLSRRQSLEVSLRTNLSLLKV